MAAATRGAADAAQDLSQKVQDLPPELFDEIYELVFTANDTIVQVDKHYEPPVQLQVDRESRDRFAEQYYTTTIFCVETEMHNAHVELGSWLQALEEYHRVVIKRTRWPDPDGKGYMPFVTQLDLERVLQNCRPLVQAGLRDCLYIEMIGIGENGTYKSV